MITDAEVGAMLKVWVQHLRHHEQDIRNSATSAFSGISSCPVPDICTKIRRLLIEFLHSYGKPYMAGDQTILRLNPNDDESFQLVRYLDRDLVPEV